MRVEPNGAPPIVLIVEDDALIRMAGIDFLKDAGFEVFDAQNADDAIAILESASEVRLIFSDINMPGTMDGLELAQLVHARWPKIKLLLTSGHESVPNLAFSDDGQFVSKPYLHSTIVHHLTDLLAG